MHLTTNIAFSNIILHLPSTSQQHKYFHGIFFLSTIPILYFYENFLTLKLRKVKSYVNGLIIVQKKMGVLPIIPNTFASQFPSSINFTRAIQGRKKEREIC